MSLKSLISLHMTQEFSSCISLVTTKRNGTDGTNYLELGHPITLVASKRAVRGGDVCRCHKHGGGASLGWDRR